VGRITPNIASITYDFNGVVDENETVGLFRGETVKIPDDVYAAQNYHVLGVANPSEKWIEVDLSEQKLRAWDGNTLFLETLVSTGLPWFATPTGEFSIWVKLRATRMEGGEGRYYYNLPNVPYVMFYESDSLPRWRGYSLHGTYWHNDFGHVHSHGCVNLPTQVAEKLYYWATPVLPEGKTSVFASPDNPGTRVIVHD
jgi:lipoprotein-anchoring transpeptidase ErfK/SrfK